MMHVFKRVLWRHPDTGEYHLVRHNDLALRQHRNFHPTSWRQEGKVHVAFFGDSFLENKRLPVQYSFTEPLDYLLNAAGKNRFNVLNFGVEGYGTEQSYLHYAGFKETNLDYVFYLFYFNDITEINNTRLFRFDANGELTNVAADRVHVLLRLLSKLHVTYLVLDTFKTLAVTWAEFYRDLQSDRLARWRDRFVGFSDAEKTESLRIFAALLRRWKTAVEAAGGAFHVVFLPMRQRNQAKYEFFLKARRVIEQDVRVQTVDLLTCAEEHIPGFNQQTMIFRNDWHWNETGNMLAARCLYRFIERGSELPRATEATLSDRLRTYYSAFRSDGAPLPLDIGGGGGGTTCRRRLTPER